MSLEINYNNNKKSVKNTNTWRPNNMLLNNQEITEEIRGNQKINRGKKINKNTTTQNLWDTAKAVLRGKLTAIQSYQEKQEKPQTI